MLDAKGLEAAKAVFNKTYVTKDGPLTAAITAYIQAVGPEPAVALKPLVEQIDALLAFENPVPPIPNLARTLLASARSALVATPAAERVVETDWINYRPLAEGEIIQAGDECLTDSHLGWQPAAHTVGGAAPDPLYTAHRMYRRPLATKPAVKDYEPGVEALLSWVCEDVLPAYGVSGEIARNDPELAESCRAALAAKDGRS